MFKLFIVSWLLSLFIGLLSERLESKGKASLPAEGLFIVSFTVTLGIGATYLVGGLL